MSSEWVSVWMVLVLLMFTVLIKVEVGNRERNFSRLQGTNSPFPTGMLWERQSPGAHQSPCGNKSPGDVSDSEVGTGDPQINPEHVKGVSPCLLPPHLAPNRRMSAGGHGSRGPPGRQPCLHLACPGLCDPSRDSLPMGGEPPLEQGRETCVRKATGKSQSWAKPPNHVAIGLVWLWLRCCQKG